MDRLHRRVGIMLSCLLIGLACLSGCQNGGHIDLFGYTSKPPVDPTIRNVYVPIAQNMTYMKGLESDLTMAVHREIGLSPFRLTSNRNNADTELILKIVQAPNPKTTIIMNQNGEVREAELRIAVEVVWRDLRPGHVGNILSNKKGFDPKMLPLPGEAPATPPDAVPLRITPSALYAPEIGGSNTSAKSQAVRTAARQIVSMMEVWPR